MSGIYFVLEVRNAHENYKIQLTKAGWDGLTKREQTRLIKMAGGSIRDAKGWIHGKQDLSTYHQAVKRMAALRGAK